MLKLSSASALAWTLQLKNIYAVQILINVIFLFILFSVFYHALIEGAKKQIYQINSFFNIYLYYLFFIISFFYFL
jgi:hypothetical protein